MKKRNCGTVIMILFFLTLIGTEARGQITYTSGFQVKNMNNTADATISIHYYNQAGVEVAPSPVAAVIPAGASVTYYPIHPTAPFNGSVVIESDQSITAIANTLGNGTAYAASTNGFTQGQTSINLPLVMRNNFGFSTWFNVQNTGSVAATNVMVTYSNGAPEGPFTIQPGAARTYDQATNTQLTPTPFVGSAVITSDQPVVATVMQIGTGGFNTLMGYNGFLGGSTTITLPLVAANNFGYYTGIQVMNLGATATNVTIAYGPNLSGAFTPASGSCPNLQPNASCTVLQREGQWGTYPDNTKRYVGAATITNSAGNNMVAIVNQVCVAGQSGCPSGSVGTSYEGFNPAIATTSISVPLAMANNFNYYSGIQVQNVGTGTCTSVNVAYSSNTSGAWNPVAESTTNLASGASYTFLQRSAQWGTYPDNTKRYVGGATVSGTGAGCLVTAIVNQVWPAAPGDQFMTYNGTNQ